MLIIPAIDIKDGCVVRLTQGNFDDEKKYSPDPVRTAAYWAAQGARLIHVVDLDGAREGKPGNLPLLKEIAKNTRADIEFGGGLRDMATIEEAFGCGIKRAVLGTKAVQDRALLKKACRLFPGKIIVSIDAKNGEALVKGWQDKGSGPGIPEFARMLKQEGMDEFIYTDILKDGTLKGPSTASIEELLGLTGMKIIASGGVSSLGDIRKLKNLEKEGLSGIIIGKALYEAKFTLKEALKI